jgi:TPR repeat protein
LKHYRLFRRANGFQIQAPARRLRSSKHRRPPCLVLYGFVAGLAFAPTAVHADDLHVQKAVRLGKLTADQGDAVARYNLGAIYTTGTKDVAQNLAEAARLYKLSAAQGYPKAA